MAHAPQNEVVLLGSAQMGDTGALAAVVRRLSIARSLDEIMSLVTYAVRSLLHADGATVVLRDGDRCYYAEEDSVSPLWKGRRFPMSACISGWCMLHRQSVAIPDIYKDSRIPVDAYRPTFVRSLAMAPIGADEPIAALGAYWSETRDIRPDELEMLQTIANSTALAVAYVQLQQDGSSNQARAAQPPRQEPTGPAKTPSSLWAWVQRIRRQGVRQNSLEAYAFAIVCVVVATLVREAVRALGVHGLVIYSTYYPAAVLAMLVGGRRAGVLATALGGLTAYYFFMSPLYQFVALKPSDAINLALYFGSCGMIILVIDWYQRTVLRLRQEDAQHLTLAREQGHRIQNAITVVESVVDQSLRSDRATAGVIKQRIRAGLAGVEIHPREDAEPKSVRALLTEELRGFELARFSFEGHDETPLAPELCTLLALAAHELATNALKYGALSTPEGRVALDWCLGKGSASLCWREQGGPPVQPPQKRGYGSILLRRLVEARRGSLKLDFQPTGLVAKISLPLPD
jgi:two-component sensor histidine kinase